MARLACHCKSMRDSCRFHVKVVMIEWEANICMVLDQGAF